MRTCFERIANVFAFLCTHNAVFLCVQINTYPVHAATARSTTMCGLHICNDITVRHREMFCNYPRVLKYVCLDLSLFSFFFRWIYLVLLSMDIPWQCSNSLLQNAYVHVFLSNVACSDE